MKQHIFKIWQPWQTSGQYRPVLSMETDSAKLRTFVQHGATSVVFGSRGSFLIHAYDGNGQLVEEGIYRFMEDALQRVCGEATGIIASAFGRLTC